MRIRAATRASALARWQTDHIGSLLAAVDPSIQIEPVVVSTAGDRDLSTPIHQIGGKGVFVKEVQQAVLDGRADIAVHSAKDLPAITPTELVVAAVPSRGSAVDVLVGARLDDLDDGATIGTGSVRRRVQLAERRPDLRFVEIRGNIDTRLGLLDDPNGPDAIVMAHAALQRLERSPAVVDALDASAIVPQVGQGTLAVECSAMASELIDRLGAIEDRTARAELDTERGFLIELGGDCDLPAGAHAQLLGDGECLLRAVLAESVDGPVHRVEVTGAPTSELGARAARLLSPTVR